MNKLQKTFLNLTIVSALACFAPTIVQAQNQTVSSNTIPPVSNLTEPNQNTGENSNQTQSQVQAQTQTVAFTPQEKIYVYNDRLSDFNRRIALSDSSVNLEQMPSLFFTPNQQSLIAEARAGFMARPPTADEIRRAENGDIQQGPREVALAGIVYLSAGDWTIWLNGQKVTPKRLPPEILDIKVRKNDVKLKWFDAYTNQIFPIKLKTHQRFNIDTRIFLPG